MLIYMSNNKEVFLFDENIAIKKLDSNTKLAEDEKKTSSDLKENNNDLKEESKKDNSEGEESKKDNSEYNDKHTDILSDIDDPFFFS